MAPYGSLGRHQQPDSKSVKNGKNRRKRGFYDFSGKVALSRGSVRVENVGRDDANEIRRKPFFDRRARFREKAV